MSSPSIAPRKAALTRTMPEQQSIIRNYVSIRERYLRRKLNKAGDVGQSLQVNGIIGMRQFRPERRPILRGIAAR